MSHSKVVVIGSGFAGLAAACCLAKEGCNVIVLEKNLQPGGRARRLQEHGFTFDMGPSWYWMPDVFEHFFNLFDTTVADHYPLVRLDPSYQVIFGPQERIAIPADYKLIKNIFEQLETGSGPNLDRFLAQAEIKYRAGIQDLVYKPGHSIWEFATLKTFKGIFNLDLFSSFEHHIRKYFQERRILEMLSFPVLFLGAPPSETPALYSLMNYADLKLGTWYPPGGMYRIIEALVDLARSLNVEFLFDHEVTEIVVDNRLVSEVRTRQNSFPAEVVVASADYQHVESSLLAPEFRNYPASYWESRVMAPSSLIFYLGIKKTLPGLLHHNLFFDEDLAVHTKEIYQDPRWPSNPLFYLCVPSKTDPSVCPPGHENLFALIPVAPGLDDTPAIREEYYNLVIDRLERYIGCEIRPHVVFKRSYAHLDFIQDYHAYKGNAYGLANTLSQTAVFKPKMKSKKVKNLFYTGQLTVPGPGVPPSLISGQITAREVIKLMQPV